MMSDLKITIIDKSTRVSTVLTGQDVSLAAQSIVELPIARAQIKSLARKDGDLVVTTVDGETIVVHGYFGATPSDHSDLVLEEGGDATADQADQGDHQSGSGGHEGTYLVDTALLDGQPEGAIDLTEQDAGSIAPVVLSGDGVVTQAPDVVATDGQETDAAVDAPQVAVAENHLAWLPMGFAAAGFAISAGGGVARRDGGNDGNSGNTGSSSTGSGNTDGGNTDDGNGASGKPGAFSPPTVSSVMQDDSGRLTVTGTAPAGSTVTVTFADHSTGTFAVGSDGSYQVTSDAPQTSGTVQAVATDQAGRESAVTTYTAISLGAISPDMGASSSDFITNEHALTFSGALGHPLAAGQTAQISVDPADQEWHAVTVDGIGWTYDDTGHPLSDGAYTVAVRVIDAAGNTLELMHQTVVVDTVAPAETVTINPSSADGLTFSGTLSAALGSDGGSAEALQISTDGGATWQTVPASDFEGNDWSYTVGGAALDAGSHTVQARVVDAAGNEGQLATQVVQVGQVAQTATLTDVDGAGVSADAGVTDFMSNHAHPTFAGKISEALGSGQQVQISLDGGDNWQPANASAGDLTWTYTVGDNVLTEGPHTVETRVVDIASGQAGSTSSQKVLIDTTAPTDAVSITTVDAHTVEGAASIAISTGALSLGGTFDAAHLNANGGSPEFIQVSFDGGKNWHTADTDGLSWSYDNSATVLPTGTYTVEARVADMAGNSGPLSVLQVVVDPDDNAPAQTAALASISPHTGASADDFITNSADHLTFAGTLSAPLTTEESVQISLDHGQTWQPATLDGDGQAWSYAADTANPDGPAHLPDGSYTVETRVYDSNTHLAGAVSVASQPVVVDSTAPTETVTIAAAIADGQSFSGTLSAPLGSNGGSPESVQISLDVDGGNNWETASVDASGLHWSYSGETPLTGSLYAVEGRVVDAAGNVGPVATSAVTVGNALNLSLSEILNVAQVTGAPVEINADSSGITTVTLSDRVGSGSTQWAETGPTTIGGVSYDVYHNASMGTDTVADLLVQAGIHVVA